MTQKIESWSPENHKQSESEKNQQDQISQIAKLISAHVSDILIQRLNLEDNSQALTEYRPRKDKHKSKCASSHNSKYKTPEMARRARSNSRHSQRNTDVRFHSEYRLNRTSRPTETPLENRAFQLRRKSLEARRAELTPRLSPHKDYQKSNPCS